MKKASLTLSIQMVVVVVIAFVVLGLGLGFVRSQFKEITVTTTAVQEQIKQQVLDDLRTGNKKLSFPATQLKASPSEEIVQAIGVRNAEDKKIGFKIEFQVKSGDQFVSFTSQTSLDDLRVAGQTDTASARVDWDDTVQYLSPGEARVYPVTIIAPDLSGNYLYKVSIKLMKIGDTDLTNNPPEYDSRTFFVKT
jgi:type II secretory pathway pseudopilin PulG